MPLEALVFLRVIAKVAPTTLIVRHAKRIVLTINGGIAYMVIYQVVLS